MKRSDTDGEYRVVVNTAGDPPDAWTGNGVSFDTWDEAERYALDLALRWTAVRDWRVLNRAGEHVDRAPA